MHPEVTYVVATDGEREARRRRAAAGEGARRGLDGDRPVVHRRASWSAGPTERPFDLVDIPADAHYVVLAEYVTTEDGTGLVHQAPAFGADDLAGLPRVRPAGGQPGPPRRHFEADVPLVGGVFFKKADEALVADLRRARPAVPRTSPYEHSYPHCWRCHTPLIYYAQPSWYIRTTAVKDRLLARERADQLAPRDDQARPLRRLAEQQRRLGAVPQPLLGHAAADLALRGQATSPASARCAELGELAGADLSALDPHRPFIDEVTFACPQTAARRRTRVPEVIDAWYDSGSMPFAQWGYPYQNKELFESRYPAQFISRGDRPDPRLVLHADGGRHAGLRPVRRTRTWSAWATSSPRTAARCPSTWATSSSRSR